MDSGKRQFLGRIGALTAGAALIPLTEISEAGINDQPPKREGMPGKRWGMAIDLRRCVGCQACTVACSVENRPPLGQFRTHVNQYEVRDGEQVAAFMLPRLCNHCDTPACIPVCPVQATFQRDDGIVVVDNQRCVGCGYCVQACPYEARFINHETNTVDKCTFCVHRLEAGLLPACVETCVGGARVIGNLQDPQSQISQLLAKHRQDVRVLKPEQDTQPRVFYIGMSEAFVSKVDAIPALSLGVPHATQEV